MGLFQRYDQEGPGVYEDDEEHGSFVTFFSCYFSKLTRMVASNLLFLAFNIPAILLAYLAAVYFLPLISSSLAPDAFTTTLANIGITAAVGSDGGDASFQLYFVLLLFVVMYTVGMNIITVGPVQTGLSYIYRNSIRRTTVFLWSDFTTTVKKNWKPSLAASGISFLVFLVLLLNISFYNNIYEGPYGQVITTVFIMFLLFFTCIQIYVYPLIASVDLSLRKIYENAFLLFLGRLVPTFGIFLLDLLVLIAIPLILLFTFTGFGFTIAIAFYFFFAFSFTQFLNTFFVWRQVEKYVLVEPVEEEETEEDGAETCDTADANTEVTSDAEVTNDKDENVAK